MYAIVYFNWSGNKEEFEAAEEAMKRISNKFDDVELVDILIPSSKWNYAALIKSKNYESFLEYTKKVREEPLTFFDKRDIQAPPRKLEILEDLEHLK